MVKRVVHVPRFLQGSALVCALCDEAIPNTMRGSLRRSLVYLRGTTPDAGHEECEACQLLVAALDANFNISKQHSPFRTLFVREEIVNDEDVNCITLGGYFSLLHVLGRVDPAPNSVMPRWEAAGSFEHLQRVATFQAPAGCSRCGAPSNAFRSPMSPPGCLVCEVVTP